MNKEQAQKFDLKKRQKSAFEAAVENAKIANEAIKSSQGWLLVLGLAEMSFLGTLLLINETIYSCWLKTLIIALLMAFVLFILGSITQYKHALRIARDYEGLSRRAVDDYLNKGIRFVDQVPQELELPKRQIVSSRITNYLIFASYVLVILVTLGIIVLIMMI